MRTLFFILAFCALGLFIASAVNLGRHLTDDSLPSVSLRDLRGFDAGGHDKDYDELAAQFKERIAQHRELAEGNQTRYLWMSFLVTLLTAASTLTSAIQAAKTDSSPARSQRFAITVAVLAFLSTLANFGSSHFNDVKTDETKKATELNGRRNQFSADYEKAAAADKPAVLRSYANRLDD